jgi:class 3 adenylate cyclase/pimeloyl-ACP methyl ester carboxylesterase
VTVSDLSEAHVTRSADGTAITFYLIGDESLDPIWIEPGGSVEILWDDPGFSRIVRRLANFRQVVAVDARGTGASGGDSTDQFEAETTHDADVLAVMDALGADRATFVGWSVTGIRVLQFAATHPERVDALVMINSCAHYVREDDYPWGYPRDRLHDIAAFIEKSWSTTAELDMTAPSRMSDDHLRVVWGRARRSGINPYEYAENLRQLCELDARHLLSSITARTLVLHREDDRFIHVGAGRYLAEHVPGAKFVLLPGEDHLYFVGDCDVLVDQIEEFLTGSRTGEANVLNTTVLFTDIVGSTEQQARLSAREWSRLTDDHDAMVSDVLGRHRGRLIKGTGDGVLAIFDANGSGIRCAIEIVNRARAMGLILRAGLDTGDVERRGGDLAGLHVNIASRVCDLAGPAEVLVSESVKTAVTGFGIAFAEHGRYELKGLPGSWQLYRVVGTRAVD